MKLTKAHSGKKYMHLKPSDLQLCSSCSHCMVCLGKKLELNSNLSFVVTARVCSTESVISETYCSWRFNRSVVLLSLHSRAGATEVMLIS